MINEAKARTKANEALHEVGLTYHPFIPNATIDNILVANGFRPMEEGIYCGREGRCSEQVSDKTWITMTWYKMPSGNYEIVAYLS